VKKQRFSPEQIAAEEGEHGIRCDTVAIGWTVAELAMLPKVEGFVHVTGAALPLLLERGGGAIVYTSSGVVFAGEPVRVAYAASKAGVNALMRHVASAWGKQGIRSHAISPGLVTSPAVMALPQDFRDACLAANRTVRFGEADDIAAMVAMLMSADGAWIQGQVITVDGGQIIR